MADWDVVSHTPLPIDTPPPPAGTPDPWKVVSHQEASSTSPGGTFENIIAGVNDTIAHGMGAPVDLANRIMGRIRNVGQAAVNVGKEAFGQHTEPLNPDANPDFVANPVGGSESIKQAMGEIGANPDRTPISSDSDRMARAIGAGVLMMAAPEAFAKDGPGMISTLMRMGRTVPAGVASGAGGEFAREVAPEPYKPLAEMAGSVAGGGLGALATEGPRTIGTVARTLTGPVTESGARTAAAGRLAGSASDIEAAKAALDKGNYQIVPGSNPTTFQVTGDMGIGSLERQSQTQSPVEFNQRRADQNAARRTVLDNLQTMGNPTDLSDYAKNRMQWLDQQTQADIEDATRFAQQRTEALGGNQHPELYGALFRQALADARNVARGRESALWEAIDPDGKLTVSASPISVAAKEIIDGLPKTAKAVTGEEGDIVNTALALDPVEPFKNIAALKSRVTDAMSAELLSNGRTQTYARLSRLRGAIEDGLNGAVEQQAQQAPDLLRSGLTQFERDAQQFTANARASRQGAGANVTGGTGNVPPSAGTAGQGGGGLGTAPGNQGVSAPTFDAAAKARLDAANAATRARVDTFDSGTIGRILQSGGRADLYRMQESSVPQTLFRPGPGGFQDVTAYLKATDPATAIPALTDYAAMALRRAAGKDDGTLDPAKATNWLRANQDALRALPADVRAKFQNAATASDVVADAMATRKQILDDYQKSAFAKLAGLDSADDATRTVGNVLNSGNRVQQMAQLAATAARNPDAMAGLRKAVADYISRRMISNTEAATSGVEGIKSDQFQTFIKDNAETLGHVFTQDEIGNMQAVAADLQRSNRSLTAVKIPGQSNTAQDLAAGGKQSVLSKLTSQALGQGAAAAAGLGMSATGVGIIPAAATWLGVQTLLHFRAAGMQRTNDIVREALLNPELAKALLAQAPVKGGGEAAIRIRSALMRSGVYGMANSQNPQ